jgi:heptosyltransferase-2
VRRVLVRCPNWLGDTIMALPTLRALHAVLPEAELWCAGPWVETLLEAEPGVTRRFVTPRTLPGRLAQARRLARAAPDLAVLLPNSFEAALAAWLTGSRWRVGYAGEGRAWLLTHVVAPPDGPVHQVQAYLGLLSALGVPPGLAQPTLRPAPALRVEARRLLGDVGIATGAPRVGIQLGAALGATKLWPSERAGRLAERLEGRGVRVVFLGSPAARDLLDAATATAGPVRSLVGRDRPALLAALLAELDVLVTADSGPAHLAAAVGVPAVTLFGPTDPRLTAPLGPGQRVLWHPPPCAPCFLSSCPIDHRCMRSIDVEEVEAAVLDALGARA